MKGRRHAVSLKSLLACVVLVGALQYTWMASVLRRHSSDNHQRGEDSDRIIPENRHRLGPIFYNVFIPENDTRKQENAIRIIKEQMQQRMWSEPSFQSPVWYTLIGSANMTDRDCQPNCQKISHVRQGDEVNTLQALWEYCQDHPEQLVTYIHDKGSFHNTEHNENTRRTATKSAFDCRIEMAQRPDMSEYNVCSGTMIILPQYLCKSNMWSAKCSYVRHLISPKNYATAMAQMYSETLLHPTLGLSQYACLRPIHIQDNHLGLGRFAFERWVWSHPDVVPADVIPMRKINFTEFPPRWKPFLSRALKGSPKRMHLHRGFGESSFARLEGRLFEWRYLYHKEPTNSSWIWDYYKGYESGTPAFKFLHCSG